VISLQPNEKNSHNKKTWTQKKMGTDLQNVFVCDFIPSAIVFSLGGDFLLDFSFSSKTLNILGNLGSLPDFGGHDRRRGEASNKEG
jgi:hypothetical protein